MRDGAQLESHERFLATSEPTRILAEQELSDLEWADLAPLFTEHDRRRHGMREQTRQAITGFARLYLPEEPRRQAFRDHRVFDPRSGGPVSHGRFHGRYLLGLSVDGHTTAAVAG